MGRREYGVLKPGMKERVRVTTDPEYYEEHSESLELWSPGNSLFHTTGVHGTGGGNSSHQDVEGHAGRLKSGRSKSMRTDCRGVVIHHARGIDNLKTLFLKLDAHFYLPGVFASTSGFNL